MKAVAVVLALALTAAVAIAAPRPAPGPGPVHGLSIHGDLKYGPGFAHFAYVNPQAPRGGRVTLPAIGTFDNLNPFILKGVPAAGIATTFDTLTVAPADEPSSEYGLLAETIETAPDRSWVAFTLRAAARFHDGSLALEAFKGGAYDLRLENVAKNWATAYDIPAVREGRIRKQEIPNEVPTGMQGFVYNTRRAVFRDARVREALASAFDFEWTNAHLFDGAYTRTRRYFSHAELASGGLA